MGMGRLLAKAEQRGSSFPRRSEGLNDLLCLVTTNL